MATAAHFSLLFPRGNEIEYTTLSDTTFHDLGLDEICKQLSPKTKEQSLIAKIMCKLTDDSYTAAYRAGIFEDIMKYPNMRKKIVDLLEHIHFLIDYGSLRKSNHDESSSIWDLMHRLDEINDYIISVESIYGCLRDEDIHSEGLISLREYVDRLYHENGFDELKKDISELKVQTNKIKSVTVGINLNERFEAAEIGLVSVNNKSFSRAPMLSGFTGALMHRENLKEGNDWNQNYSYHPLTTPDGGKAALARAEYVGLAFANPMAAILGMSAIAHGDSVSDVTRYMEKAADHMLYLTCHKLKEVLDKYVTISAYDFAALIPEFMYYIRWAEYIEAQRAQGYHFGRSFVLGQNYSGDEPENNASAKAIGFYNLKLIGAVTHSGQIVVNNLVFDDCQNLFILTGANRGGKTTVTQAVGQLFVLAQGGIYIPGENFVYKPVDRIFTHFPADEDKTLDLGRLGEECKRFKELYSECTRNSLVLLNETFSTTSFEEGYYIACDAVKALITKGIRGIYNTHMHKLAHDIDSFNSVPNALGQTASLIVKSDGGYRSYRIAVAPPEDTSYANDIALKYGVTYQQLIDENNEA